MGLDVYFRRDIDNVLRAVASAAEGPEVEYHPGVDNYARGWHDGFKAALVAVGLAFGLQQMVEQGRKGPEWIEVERGSDG